MASSRILASEGPAPAFSLVRPGHAQAQVEVDWDQVDARLARLRLRTLITLRWRVIAVELFALGIGAFVLRLQAPYGACLAVVGAAAWINLLTSVVSPGQRQCSAHEATAQLSFDIGQIAILAFLTGGSANPFILLMIAPITLAATSLPRWQLLLLSGLGVAASLLLAVFAWAPASGQSLAQAVPLAFRLGASSANIAGIALIAGYVRQVAMESARMGLALDVTQAVLAREQKLSALGALAAAAAHELGTPLATISIVARELSRDAATPGLKDDADLLIAQAERCREILKRLTDSPETADQLHGRMSLLQLLHEVIEPQAGAKGVRVEAIVVGAAGAEAPDIWRMPEILHALTTVVENAVDFAASEVLVTARYDDAIISMEVRDDGPGFAPEILARLGEPYLTTRPGAEGSRTGHVGMGLGFFIAKTLLERSGGVVTAQNGRPRGAIVSTRWARAKIEVRTG